uniref:Vinculin/alpha-catenin family member 1 n=1 Tax=Peromyscus maniculatus bairdii TaxID=230844 RepID=A0A8C8T3V1_PERMB
MKMDSFLWDDFSPMIRNRAMEQIITPMTVQLCHLLISVERKDVQNEALTSLQKVAEGLASASEEFVYVASRLAADSEEEWFREEMQTMAESLSLSGRNMLMVTEKKLPLQPESQHHWEELVATAQQILVDTTKILLLEDAAMVRKTVPVAGWCLTCLEALEAAEDATSLRASLADLAAALLQLGGLTTRWAQDERLGRVRHQLGCCIPALLAATRGHLRHPYDPQLVASRRRVYALTRQSLRELLVVLQPGVAGHGARSQNGALAHRLQKLRQVLEEPGPSHLRDGLLDAPLAAVVWHCLRLAACSTPRERMHLVSHCHRLLQLHPGVHRSPQPISGAECEALRAATDALFQGVRAGLLRQILDTFTDTQSPLERLVQAALTTSTIRSECKTEALAETLRLLLDAFHNQAKQMIRVARLVWVCCPQQQTGRDVEAAVAGLWGLVVKAKELFSQGPQTRGLDWSPATLQALLEAWARESEHLLACFDVVLDIPEFLSLSIQEMTEHLNLYTRALRSGASGEFSRSVTFLRGRATHIVQVMSRYVGQDPDPIFRNGMRVVVQQLAQSSLTLAAATDGSTGRDSAQDAGAFLTMAKHLIYSAQQVHEGLDGTNHPDILSPLRFQVQRFDIATRWPYFILPSLQQLTAPAMKYQQQAPGLEDSGTNSSFLPAEQLSYTLVPDPCKQGWGSPFLAVNKVITAMENQDHRVVTSPRTNLPERESSVNTAQEIQAEEEPLGPERTTTKPHEFSTVVPLITDLATEEVHSTNTRSSRLLGVAFQQSGWTREARQALVARAGDWYRLCQQLFFHSLTAELPGSMAAFMELQQNLASMVQLAGKSGPVKSPDPMEHPGVLLELQSRLEKTETHAQQLLDQVLSSDGLQASTLREEDIGSGCLLWAAAVQDLMQCMERLSRRPGLFLLPLQQAVKNQKGLQEGLDQAADVSQRLQEAAELSSVLCGDEQVKGEVSFLCGEVHVLTDALLEVVHILVSSPKPCPSLSTRFELLCLELSLRAKALTDYLSSINAVYEHMFQDAVGKRSQTRMLSVIQAVQGIIAGGQESGSFQEDLLVSLESMLMLTKEVAKRVPVLQEHPEELGLHLLDRLRWEWAAKAHHAVTQLQALEGCHTEAWRLLVQCLKPREEPAKGLEEDPVQLQPYCKEGAPGTTEGGSGNSQDAVPKGTPENSVEETCADELATTGTPTADVSVRQSGSPSLPPAQMDQTVPDHGSAHSENRITQLTQEMAKEVLLMAQSLRKRGPGLTKDQLIASARKISASGKNITRLIGIIAKNCIDQRCSHELLCMVEQIQTMCSQLSIISSVKASLARSKSSEELLVENAQRLLQAVSKTVRAAEAACLRGLRWLSSDPEELEVAAFCSQWKRKLLQHRLQEASNKDCDELGLRKTSTGTLPELAALVQEA